MTKKCIMKLIYQLSWRSWKFICCRLVPTMHLPGPQFTWNQFMANDATLQLQHKSFRRKVIRIIFCPSLSLSRLFFSLVNSQLICNRIDCPNAFTDYANWRTSWAISVRCVQLPSVKMNITDYSMSQSYVEALCRGRGWGRYVERERERWRCSRQWLILHAIVRTLGDAAIE